MKCDFCGSTMNVRTQVTLGQESIHICEVCEFREEYTHRYFVFSPSYKGGFVESTKQRGIDRAEVDHDKREIRHYYF